MLIPYRKHLIFTIIEQPLIYLKSSTAQTLKCLGKQMFLTSQVDVCSRDENRSFKSNSRTLSTFLKSNFLVLSFHGFEIRCSLINVSDIATFLELRSYNRFGRKSRYIDFLFITFLLAFALCCDANRWAKVSSESKRCSLISSLMLYFRFHFQVQR